MMQPRKAFLLIASALAAFAALATPVTGEQAATAVGRWLRSDSGLGCRLGGAVETVRTCATTNGVRFHVVRLDGGGFAVTSADTQLEPVVAFSSADDLLESAENPFWVLLTEDFAARGQMTGIVARVTSAAAHEAKWAKLLDDDTAVRSVASVSDVRVAPLVQSRWNQDDVEGLPCYNYYTPNNYVCGCVATGGGQLMRYFNWPVTSMAQYTCSYCNVNGVNATLTTQGGIYDWSAMPLVPTSSITLAERQAIGKLTSDVGICCGMHYYSNGSGTGGYMLAKALVEHFGYSGVKAHEIESMSSAALESFWNALISNLDAGLPVGVGIKDTAQNAGHFVIGDGYGYSGGTLYCHFNMGWGGYCDAWYAPPDMAAGGNTFDVLDTVVYNIYTNQPANAVIVSGRVLDSSGNPVAGAAVTARTASGTTVGRTGVNAKGIYSFMLQPGEYVLTGEDDNSTATITVSLNACVSMNLCDESSGYFGSYWQTPQSSVGNKCGQDIVLSGLVSVEPPVFNPASCIFHPTTNVTISCATAGATIRYTTDGSEPDGSSAIYTSAITVAEDTVIKARAYKSGMNPSVTVTATYTYDITKDAPAGDFFALPIAISGQEGTRTISDNSVYTLEDDEPFHTLNNNSYYHQAHSIWYAWTAPGSGTMTFTTGAKNVVTNGNMINTTSLPTLVAVYTGDELASATRVAFSGDYQSSGDYTTSVSVDVEQGVTYRIVGAVMNASYTGQFTLAWNGSLVTIPAAEPVRLGSDAELWYSSLAQDGFILFFCDTAWTIAASDGWLTPQTVSGSGDAISNRYAIAANGTGASRTARLVVTDATGAAVTQTVHQTAATAPPAVTNRYYGLFVGVNEYKLGIASTLNGCVNDAAGMCERFTDWGFCRRADALLLTNSLATVAAVRDALTNIAARATAGDTVLFYQASHGHLATGATVALVEHDGYYWDYDLAADLGTFADGVRVVVMADTCNSGGLFKRGDSARRKFDLARRVQEIMAANRSSGGLLKARSLSAPGDIGWITAADYDQSSWDYKDHGLFTYLCLDGWETGAADADGDGRVSFYDLWLYAKDIAAEFVAQAANEVTEAQCLNEEILLAALAGVTDASTSETETYSAPVRVPHDWLDGWMAAFGYTAAAGEHYSYADYNSAALGVKTTPSGAKVAVWQDYMAGTVPTNPASVFTADISITNGTPYVTWSPDLGPSLREYTVLGKEHLTAGDDWGPTNAASRFFKVEVRMKGNAAQ